MAALIPSVLQHFIVSVGNSRQDMGRKSVDSEHARRAQEEFVSLYDLLTSIERHLSSIESSVTVIRKTAEDTNTRVRGRAKVRERHGKVP